jgi:uncharacterized protein
MLHSYAFANFRSFLERVEVSFVLTEKDSVIGWDRVSRLSGQRLTTAMAVMGPNASGKTSLLLPLAFLAYFVRHSFSASPDSGVPIVQHFNGDEAPTEFELVADAPVEDTLLRYRLTTTTSHVLAESLERKVRRGNWYPIFDRQRTNEGKYKVVQNEFGLDQTQAENVRPNVSLISWAAQFDVALAKQLINFVMTTNMNIGGRFWQPNEGAVNWSVQYYAQNPAMQARMLNLLARWDLGLSDVMFQEQEIPGQTGETKKQWFAYGVHRDAKTKTHYLPFAYESSGTKAVFMLLALFLPVLEHGGVIAYDELDSDLHPHMLEPLLDMFSNPETNPHNAQIIFTCHAVEVLRLLQKSQVMLVEKDGLESHAWRLDSMEGVRSDDNRVAKYLAGAYGAVPRL